MQRGGSLPAAIDRTLEYNLPAYSKVGHLYLNKWDPLEPKKIKPEVVMAPIAASIPVIPNTGFD